MEVKPDLSIDDMSHLCIALRECGIKRTLALAFGLGLATLINQEE